MSFGGTVLPCARQDVLSWQVHAALEARKPSRYVHGFEKHSLLALHFPLTLGPAETRRVGVAASVPALLYTYTCSTTNLTGVYIRDIMSSNYTLQFAEPSSSSQAIVTYSLVELPPAIASLLFSPHSSSSSSSPSSLVPSQLVIKGQPSDDAVLCTQSSTYNIRSVQNSNSLLLCRPSTSASVGDSDPFLDESTAESDRKKQKKRRIEIESTLHQTLELELAVPKLDNISAILKGQEWSPEEQEKTEELIEGASGGKKVRKLCDLGR